MLRPRAPLRICIDARVAEETGQGVERFIIGLAGGLSALEDGDEEYLFLTYSDNQDWIRPYLSGPCRALSGAQSPQAARRARTDSILLETWRKLSPLLGSATIRVPRSDGTIESAGAAVMHFTRQEAFLTSVPSIFHPHDLQHVHLPQYFGPRERLYREVLYRRFCREARMVAVASSWVREDVIAHFGIPEDQVCVVPLAPTPNAVYELAPGQITAAKRKFRLPEAFAFYPAQTWPHKNHLVLLEALSLLSDRSGLRVPLVLSGFRNDYCEEIENRVVQLKLETQVQFLGFVTPVELQSLYAAARCVVIPSLFEAASFPLWEAFLLGAPVACSNVTSLPQQAGDAALVFDPRQPGEIAEAIERLWLDESLRKTLVERGKRRVAAFKWRRTATLFRAHYRRIAGRMIGADDAALLAEPPLL